ncbi:MAG: metallophosphoesterase family protein [Flavobacteriaceae bacterium]|nr:serine/threonine protein phosphatase [Flavobacteriaceae bacterium]
MRTLVVGDIHGGLKALKQLLEKVHPSVTDQFIFLGDYVDGWSESAQTVSFLIEFSKKYPSIFLRGNHDELTYNYLKHGDDNPLWLNHGGSATKKSYERFSSSVIEVHFQFFQKLKNYHIDSQNRLFVHAGFTNLNGPQHEYYPNLVYWDRTLWEMACSLDKNLSKKDVLYPSRLQLFSEIYIGHTPTTRLGKTTPINYANVWNIDTGAAFKGPLSMIDIDTKEIWQSDPVYKLYPSEKGRN